MQSNPKYGGYFEEPHSKYDSMKAPAKISVYSEEQEYTEVESGKGNFESDWPLNPSYQKGNHSRTRPRTMH